MPEWLAENLDRSCFACLKGSIGLIGPLCLLLYRSRPYSRLIWLCAVLPFWLRLVAVGGFVRVGFAFRGCRVGGCWRWFWRGC